MCQICEMNALSYANSGGPMGAAGGESAQAQQWSVAPQWGGSGANFWALQNATGNTNTNGVLSGSKWGGTTLTYSFPTLTSQYEVGYGNETTNDFFAATNGIKEGIRYGMNLLSQYTNMVTTEIDGLRLLSWRYREGRRYLVWQLLHELQHRDQGPVQLDDVHTRTRPRAGSEARPRDNRRRSGRDGNRLRPDGLFGHDLSQLPGGKLHRRLYERTQRLRPDVHDV
jgi:hypothetical protein